MNDSWRRATVGGPYGNSMSPNTFNVSAPFPTDRLAHTTSPTRLRMLEDEMRATQRSPNVSTGGGSHEADLLRIENTQLRREAHELKGQYAAALAERQVLRRQIEDLSISRDCEASSGRHDRGVILDENRMLKDENNRLRNQLLLCRQDQGSLEQTVAELRTEIVQNNRVLVDQNETVRALTQEMSRRHPAQLVKYQREVQTDSATISELTRKLSEATVERDRGFQDVKRVEAELKLQREEASRAVAVLQQRLNEAMSQNSPSTRSDVFKRELLVATEHMRAKYEQKIEELIAENEQLRKSAYDAKDQIAKVKKSFETEKAQLNAKVTDIKSQATEAKTTVSVAVHSCANLLDVNPSDPNSTDPFVVLFDHLDKKVLTTDVIDNTLNPTFKNQSVAIEVPLRPSRSATLTAKVYHFDKPAPLLIGTAQFPIADILSSNGSIISAKLAPQEKETSEMVAKNANKLGSVSLRVTIPSTGNKSTAVDRALEAPKPTQPEIKPKPKPVGDQRILIKVLKGANLFSTDWRSADPYVQIIGVDGNVLKETPHISSTLDPTWDGPNAQVAATVPATGEGYIMFKVWDSDINANDFMGCAKVSVNDILNNASKTYVLKLEPREKEPEAAIRDNAGKLGTLTVNISQINAENKFEGQAPVAVAGSVPVPTDSQKAKALREGIKEVIIHVAGCTNVLNRDGLSDASTGLSDVFVRVLDPKKKEILKTPVVLDSLNPTFEFAKASLTLAIDPRETGVYTFEAWDRDDVGNDDFLGCVTIPPDVLIANGNCKLSLDLKPSADHDDKFITQNAANLGKMQINITVTNPEERVATQGVKSNAGTVDIIASILKCEGLLKRNRFMDSDPFIMVYRGADKLLHTPKVDNTCDPVFPPSTTVQFKVAAGDFDGTIRFEVWDQCTPSNKFQGEARISIQEIINSATGKVNSYQLTPREKEVEDEINKYASRLGRIFLKFENVTAVAAAPEKASTPLPPKPPQEEPKQPRNVTLYIEGCDSILDRDTIGGHSDPFVKIIETFNGKEKELLKTPFIDNNASPRWDRKDASCNFTAYPTDTSTLRIEVWDDDATSADFLGCVLVPVKDIYNKTLTGKIVKPLGPREKEPEDYITKNAANGGLGKIIFNIEDGSIPIARAPSKQAETPQMAVIRKVKVTVQKAEGLCDVEGMTGTKSSDPYVTVTVPSGEEKLKTNVEDDTLNPVWKSNSFVFTASDSEKGQLTFTVWDKNNIGSDTCMGMATLSIADIAVKGNITHALKLAAPSGSRDKKLLAKGTDLGTLYVVISNEDGSLGKGADAAKEQLAEVQKAKVESSAKAAPAPAPVQKQYRINAWVKNLKNIIAADIAIPVIRKASSDPRVVAFVGSKEVGATSVVQNSLNPVWNESEGTIKGIDVATNSNQSIVFKVQDEDVTNFEDIGEITLLVDDVIAHMNEERVFNLINNNEKSYKGKDAGSITLFFTYQK